jgi:hypothetical protein
MLSGVAAAGFTFGLRGTFNFNGAKYNISTRTSSSSVHSRLIYDTVQLEGIVPTIEDYSGSDGVPDANGTRLGFSGGNVTVNTGVIPGSHRSVPIPQGFSTNYSMSQQGLTAYVNCRAIDSSQMQYLWDTSDSYLIYANAAASNNSITGLRLWNISANCGTSKFDLGYLFPRRLTASRFADNVPICDHGGCRWKCELIREWLSSIYCVPRTNEYEPNLYKLQ